MSWPEASKIKHHMIRPKAKDYKNQSDYFQDVCKYIELKFEDTYKSDK
tara:strand:+ start:935 stop:1078 length:144 start_codon:yes stop_codon:yes gene_type:complete